MSKNSEHMDKKKQKQSSTLMLWISRPIRNGEMTTEIGLRFKI